MGLVTTSIIYYRSTSYSFDVNITPPQGHTISKGLFTVKDVKHDQNSTDGTALLKKEANAVDNSVTFDIDPSDIADTVAPDNFYYSIHVILDDGTIAPFAAGRFVLRATTTNREA